MISPQTAMTNSGHLVSRLAEQLVRKVSDQTELTAALKQLKRERTLDFPWYPARVVCHDIWVKLPLWTWQACGRHRRARRRPKQGQPCGTNPADC